MLPSEVNVEQLKADMQNPRPRVAVDAQDVPADIQFQLANGLCSDCKFALTSVLTSNYPPNLWARTEGTDATILVYRKTRTRTSGQDGCPACTYLDPCFSSLSSPASDQDKEYRIFVKAQPPDHGAFRICRGDATRFAASMRFWSDNQDIVLDLFSMRKCSPLPRISSTVKERLARSEHGLPFLRKLPNERLLCKETIRNIRSWIDHCTHAHRVCKRNKLPLGARILDIDGAEATGKVRLYSPTPADSWEYATVTYSWGGKEGEHRRLPTKNSDSEHPELTEENHRKGIAIDKFPASLQDAIKVACRLGFRYLWIDSVCIIQDSDPDWDKQTAILGQIYGGAAINISATSGMDSEHGINHTVQHSSALVGFMHRATDQASADERHHDTIQLGQRLPDVDLEDYPAATRGWIFQERLVSPATVHFTDQGIVWECVQGLHCDRDQRVTRATFKQRWAAAMGKDTVVPVDPLSDEAKESLFRTWNDWMAAYAARNLYEYTDRLAAIAGLAHDVASRYRLTYVAGVWHEDLIQSLMWRRHRVCTTLTRFKGDVIPSWSCASVQGRLDFRRVDLIADDVNGPVVQRITGPVPTTEFKLRGLLQRGSVADTGVPNARHDNVVTGFLNNVNVEAYLDSPGHATPGPLSCWFLRMGSVPDDDRTADVFLILSCVDEHDQVFRRIGMAQTEPFYSSEDGVYSGKHPILDSGRLTAPNLETIHLV